MLKYRYDKAIYHIVVHWQTAKKNYWEKLIK